MNPSRAILLGTALALAGASASVAADDVVTVVYSQTYNGYARTKLSDGSIKPETFAIGDAGRQEGTYRDASIDSYRFDRLMRVLTPYLARKHYVPGKTPQNTDLMIVVHWGTSIPYSQGSYQMAMDSYRAASAPTADQGDSHQIFNYLGMMQLADHQRDQDNRLNAGLLGYLPELQNDGIDYPPSLFRDVRLNDLIADLEEERFYVILAAYDFQLARAKKQLRPLWITRVSIRARGHQFDQDVDTMIAAASHYFGQDSQRLIQKRIPEGTVEVGEPRVVEPAPAAGK